MRGVTGVGGEPHAAMRPSAPIESPRLRSMNHPLPRRGAKTR
jgi:hypothetical protein